jgi:hypothetical protein
MVKLYTCNAEMIKYETDGPFAFLLYNYIKETICIFDEKVFPKGVFIK